VWNDGHNPFESLPYYKKFIEYKEFAKKVDKRAVHTLQLVVQKLLGYFKDCQEQELKGRKVDKVKQLWSLLQETELQEPLKSLEEAGRVDLNKFKSPDLQVLFDKFIDA